MSTKTIPSVLALLALMALGACNTDKPEQQQQQDYADVPCICGTPEAALHGCPHPLCLAGKENPDNPDCVCGPLDYETEGDN